MKGEKIPMYKKEIKKHGEKGIENGCGCCHDLQGPKVMAHDKCSGSKLLHGKFRIKHDELHQYFRAARYLRPAILIINLVILYLLFRWIGIKTVGIYILAIFVVKEMAEFLFMCRLERRIIKPIDELKKGFEELSSGNYSVKVRCDVCNDLGLLICSFNDMAEKLQESEKVKAEYEENRKMLIANISHDLKTPITSVQGYIEAVLDGNAVSQDDLKKYLQIIYRNTDYINRLIDDLFLYSKLDMQKLNFNFENIKVKAYMNDLVEEFKFYLEEKQFKLIYEDKIEQECMFKIDRKRMHQAVRNIIGNAEKYGPDKGLEIYIRLYKENDMVCINIMDNGPGISEDKLKYIFDRFYRIDNERRKDPRGTGLGLSIARELIEAHGGKISVESRENEGTSFLIAIPAV